MQIMPKKALISVSEKEGIVDFASGLLNTGVQIISTGGTASLLKKNGIEITEISDFTGFPEILDGRVKTLNPKVHAGILNIRDNSAHRDTMKSYGFDDIDMVVVNLYPFEKTISSMSATVQDAVENIDIGGPTMIRSAAKNFKYVASVVDKNDYDVILSELNSGGITLERRMELARKAFTHTAMYDGIIATYFNRLMNVEFAEEVILPMRKKQDLRYGENPHQKASFYVSSGFPEVGIAHAGQLHGKKLSFNNIMDANAAYELVREFTAPACVIVKHTNPCGVATSENHSKAYDYALSCDPQSAFGGIVAFNGKVDGALAGKLSDIFLEVVIAISFTKEALDILKKKKNLRLLEIRNDLGKEFIEYDIKRITGGYLLQDRDTKTIEDTKDLKIVTKRSPVAEEYEDLLFAWKVAKHVKSNAIVYAKNEKTIGIGAGQMSRVDSSRIAAEKAKSSLEGAAMASDAFFPFRDSVDEAAARGIKSIIQPGGSIRDEEVIKAADEHGIAMVFTGIRHFKH